MHGPTNKLTDTKIESELKTARRKAATVTRKSKLLGDGGGLTLQISPTGTASWLYRYMRQGKATAIGLGPYPALSLKEARLKAQALRELRAQGNDPLMAKRDAAEAAKLEAAKEKTFDECAKEYIEDHRQEWKSAKHAAQWEATLETYASPVIGKRPIDQITTAELKRILNPIWSKKHETASRLRGRIAAVIDWATAHGLRAGENPARWTGHLEHLLARSTAEKRADKHHAALPYAEIPAFMAALAPQDGMSRWALEFLILAACRTSEVTGAKWAEFDMEKCLWTIPKERMKAGKEHRVPLVDRALSVLATVRPWSLGEYVFPGGNKDKPLSNMAMTMLLRRMNYAEKTTVHGLRSTFRDYIGAETAHDFRTAEEALAHKLQDKASAAYARSDLFEKRFAMMRDWERFCYSALQGASNGN